MATFIWQHSTMKTRLRRWFNPILTIFEQDSADLVPSPHARKLLYVLSGLFIFLALVFPLAVPGIVSRGFWFPMLVFLAVGITGLVVATLGTDGAVARIWGSKGRR